MKLHPFQILHPIQLELMLFLLLTSAVLEMSSLMADIVWVYTLEENQVLDFETTIAAS